MQSSSSLISHCPKLSQWTEIEAKKDVFFPVLAVKVSKGKLEMLLPVLANLHTSSTDQMDVAGKQHLLDIFTREMAQKQGFK